MRFAFYGRVSTEDAQDPSLSIPRQLAACQRLIRESGGELYWLVYVKPRRIGHFALKYNYKYAGTEYPEEGENELIIRVGGKNCSQCSLAARQDFI